MGQTYAMVRGHPRKWNSGSGIVGFWLQKTEQTAINYTVIRLTQVGLTNCQLNLNNEKNLKAVISGQIREV